VPVSRWTINVVLRAGTYVRTRRSHTYYHERGTRQVFVTVTWELRRALAQVPAAAFLAPTPLSRAINNSARGRFLWLRNERTTACARSLTRLRARTRAHLSARCVVRHPTALLHPAAVGLRGTMAHYIMEYGCAIYRRAGRRDAARRRSPARSLGPSGTAARERFLSSDTNLLHYADYIS